MKILEKLQFDLNNFNADTAARVRLYWKDTGLKINLIYSMVEIRDFLNDYSNPGLNQKFKTLKKDFVQYLSDKMKGDLDERDDLIFEIREVARLQLKEGVPRVVEDIQQSTLPLTTQSSLIQALQQEDYAKVLEELKD